ncbi:MAG: Cell division protein FtsZ [Acetothermia bacterium 64_32]|nr:MAG: Cell division protein FtsZ [Acetothermia bacterium 64_32]HAF69867.1 cell division protein FtsZ [Candidatus Acetothermia bacterium]
MNGESPARLMVVGVGGGGGNAVDRMMRAGLQGVELVAVNTDAQVLAIVKAHQHLQIGRKLTGGLGAGGDPEIGRLAAEESREEIADLLSGLDMVFVTAGMGGGTGTGAAPVIAEVAKELGILTVAIVTRPFSFEGLARAQRAEVGIQNLAQNVDAIVTISNDKLLKVAPPDMPLTRAFELVDEVLRQGVQGITDLITVPGLINLDFADVESVLRGAGTAMMGIGEAEGENKTREAARRAISSPLLDATVKGAKKAILNITGGEDLTLEEVTEAASVIHEALSDKADLIFGATIREGMQRARVTVIATGFPPTSGGEVAESEEEAILERIEREGILGDDYDIPTFLRKSRRTELP